MPKTTLHVFRSLLTLLLLSLFQYLPLRAQIVYALSGNTLISFDVSAPTAPLSTLVVSGIDAGLTLEGIDFRPNTGQLYGIGYNQSSGATRLYTISTQSGAATAVGAGPVMLQPNMGEVNFDFNPTVDRIRVTGSNTANYRLHPVTGAIAATDGALAFGATDVNAGQTPFIAAGAYTNSFIGASVTTLYNYDAHLNVLCTQVPPNNGTCNTIGVSGLNLDMNNPQVDLDIFFNPATQTNLALLTTTTGVIPTTNIYSVNLGTGQCTQLNPTGILASVDDIAFQINHQVPAQITGQLVYAVTANNNLISFDSENPSLIRTITPITGVFAAQTLAGIDFRPATGELYGIGYNNTSGMARLYTLNVGTGMATAVGADSVMLQANMGTLVFDFNPTVDRIRVMGRNGANFRMHPVTGALAATDQSLAYANGDVNQGTPAAIGAGAYTNCFNGTTSTTLYDYDVLLNVLATQIPPNNGALNTIGASGIVVNPAAATVDMDIFYAYSDGSNTAYLSANTGSSMNDGLYTLNLNTGAATLAGSIGLGIQVRSIAVVLDTPPPAVFTFTAQLSGQQQVAPVATTGAGSITATLSGNTLTIEGSFSQLTGALFPPITGSAHLHSGYAGQNGPVEFELTATPDIDAVSGTFNAALNTFTLSNAQVDLLKNRQMYINLHTNVFADGELRGQLLPVNDGQFGSNVFGSNQVPGLMSKGSGALVMELHSDTLIVSGSFAGTEGVFAGVAHLHAGLAGQTGNVVLELNAMAGADQHSGLFTAASNTFQLSADQLAALQNQALYVNVHTDVFPAGELRGQVTAAANATFRAFLNGASQYPFVTSTGSGQMIAALNGNTLTVSGAMAQLESAVQAAHIHLGAAGTSGGVAFELNITLDADGLGGVCLPAQNTYTLTSDQVRAFLDRNWYINVHTSAHPGGEIRGQLLLESQFYLYAPLTGSQQLPQVSSAAHGAVAAEVSGSRLTLSGSFAELSSAIDLNLVSSAVLYAGLPGQSGADLLELTPALDIDLTHAVFEVNSNTFRISSGLVDTLMQRGSYINVHSMNFPAGEIRGNLLAEANAYFCAPLSGASQLPAVNSTGTGMLVVELNPQTATVVGAFGNLNGAVDINIAGGAHIHFGLPGSNGNIAAELDANLDAGLKSGVFEAANITFELTAGLWDTLRQRLCYVNLHTTTETAGEIRGQLFPLAASYFHTTLDGLNQAIPVLSTGTGSVKLDLNGNTLTCAGSFASLQGAYDANIAGGAHIHIGAPGNNGNIVLELDATLDAGLQSGVFTATDNTFELTDDQVAAVRAGNWYVNIHTTTQAAGEIRGQIFPEINFFPTNSDFIQPLPGAQVTVAGQPTDLFNVLWTPADDPNGDAPLYIWQLALDADFSAILFTTATGLVPGTALTLGEVDAFLAAGGVTVGGNITLYHRVIVTDGCNINAGAGAQVTLQRGIVVGTSDLPASLFRTRVFPTLSAGQPFTFEVTADQTAQARLTLYNTYGVSVYDRALTLQNGVQQYVVPADLPAGVYYLQLGTDKGTLPAHKVIVQR